LEINVTGYIKALTFNPGQVQIKIIWEMGRCMVQKMPAI
jgi:hypothetical protein